jgi:hypothetical protein
VRDEAIVRRQFVEPVLRFHAEQFDRVVVEGREQVFVDPPEEEDRVGIPAPPEVVGQFIEPHQFFRNARQDGVTADFHRAKETPQIGRQAPTARLVYPVLSKDEG